MLATNFLNINYQFLKYRGKYIFPSLKEDMGEIFFWKTAFCKGFVKINDWQLEKVHYQKLLRRCKIR